MTATTTLPKVLDALSAVGHPLRARILIELRNGPASPNMLAGARVDPDPEGVTPKAVRGNPRGLGASLGTVAYHVRTLDEAGMIELAYERRVRGAVEHIYRLTNRGRAKVKPLAVLAGGTVTITP